GLPVVHREDPVLIAGEVGELVDVVPHPLVGGVEQVRAVAVHLDTGLRLLLGVRVAAQVRAPLQHQDTLVQLRGGPLGHGQAEESGSDDNQVIAREAHGNRAYRGHDTLLCPGRVGRTSAATSSSTDSLPSYGPSALGQWPTTSVKPRSVARPTMSV